MPDSANNQEVPHYDLLIIGYGMVGSIAALLAIQYKLKVAVLELRQKNDLYVSKAGRIDAEVLRIFEHLGLRKEVDALLQPLQGTQVTDKKGNMLFEFHHPEVEGCSPMYGFYQPDLQRLLHQKINERGGANLTIYEEHKAEAIEQKNDRINIIAQSLKSEKIFEIRTRFLLACNGQESLVPAQCDLKYQYFGYSNYTLNVDTLRTQAKKTPFFAQTICDSLYPVTCITDSETHQRWEFQLDPDALTDPKLSDQIRVELESLIEVPFELQATFMHAYETRILEKWQRKRIFIAGDAAHVIPPYIGMSLAAGIKDVYNLIWKLAMVSDRVLEGKILDYYQGERESNVRYLLQLNLGVKRLFNSVWFKFAKVFLPLIPKGLLKKQLDLSSHIRIGLVGAWSKMRGKMVPHWKFSTAQQPIAITADRLFGDGFVLMALNENPVDALSPKEIEYLAHIGCRFINIVSQRGTLKIDGRVTEQWLDTEGAFEKWCLKHRAKFVLLRPDRFIFDTANTREQLHKVLQLLKTKMPLRIEE